MIVLVDIGNTRSKYVIVQENQFSDIKYLENQQLNDASLSEHFSLATEIIVANVNDVKLSHIIKSWAAYVNVGFQLLSVKQQEFEITCAYSEPSRLGIDRWLAMLAAVDIHPKQMVMIVDAGTATTLDMIDETGRHLGGWILPGIDTMVASILSATSNVVVDKSVTPSIKLGCDTSACVVNAAWGATAGAINLKIIEHGADLPILITGGNGEQLLPFIQGNAEYMSELVFKGMYRFRGLTTVNTLGS